MNFRVKTQWFSDLPKYHYFETESAARQYIESIGGKKSSLWWVLEKRQ